MPKPVVPHREAKGVNEYISWVSLRFVRSVAHKSEAPPLFVASLQAASTIFRPRSFCESPLRKKRQFMDAFQTG